MDKASLHNWKHHPVTKEVMQMLRDKQQELFRDMTQVSGTCEQIALATTYLQGMVKGMDIVLEVRTDEE